MADSRGKLARELGIPIECIITMPQVPVVAPPKAPRGTPHLDQLHELEAKHPLLAHAYRAAHGMAIKREEEAVEAKGEASARAAQAKATRRIVTPHLDKYEQLVREAPMAARVYLEGEKIAIRAEQRARDEALGVEDGE